MANMKLMCDNDPNFYVEVEKLTTTKVVIPPTVTTIPTTTTSLILTTTPFFTLTPKVESPQFSVTGTVFGEKPCKRPFETLFMDDTGLVEILDFLGSRKVGYILYNEYLFYYQPAVKTRQVWLGWKFTSGRWQPQFESDNIEKAKLTLSQEITSPIEGRCAAVHYNSVIDEFGNF